jgi:Zn-dependent M28 family amino/carboxypeptidase
MSLRRCGVFVCGVVLMLMAGQGGLAKPGGEEKSPFEAVDTQILSEIREHSEAGANLEYLSDSIGARLTGSPQLKQANDWTRDMFAKYGAVNAHLEGWTVEHSWTRGKASARIVSPTQHPLTIAAAGWSPSTPGTITGAVVYFDAKEKKDFAKFHGKLKGAIVIYQEPASLSPPKPEEPLALMSRPMQQPPPRFGEAPLEDPYAAFLKAAKERTEFWKQESVAGVLRDSNKPHGLLNMTGVSLGHYDIGPIPTAFITGEGYRTIFRMMQKHLPVQVEMEMTNSVGDKPMTVYNTVAEIRGSEKPDEVVIIGAHLDSWDLGTGSTDNGTGSMAVLEAARALAKLNLKPKRTIRFVLFSGEEQGLYGSQEYVRAHKNDLEKISGVLVHDTGTGRVLTLGLHDNYQDRELVDQVLAPLHELKLLEPKMARSFGTDHLSFDEVGVPGFFCIQDRAEYNLTHHSQSDTFDKVWKDTLDQGAEVLATWAYNTANLPDMLPRRPLPYNPGKDMKGQEAPKPDPVAEMDTKILEQVKADAPALQADLTYLTEHIGPRLTGSAKLDEASHWTAEQFKAAGLSNVHLEDWTIANSWTRGPATGRLIAPTEHVLTLAAAGWSPSTKGVVRGPIVAVRFEKLEDLEPYKGKLKGAIVLFGRPRKMEAPESPLATPWGESTIPLAHAANEMPVDPGAYRQARLAAMKIFAEEKVSAVLLASEKDFGLLNMSAQSRDYQAALVPVAYAIRENYEQLWHLQEEGHTEAEVSIEGSLSGKPAQVYNTVAEIRGREKPDEVVIIGAHLDSWDLGTGATDNGTGSMAVLAAARALQKVGVKPKRTIRFVLFTGEEQGLNGSRAYVKAHKDELPKISGALVHDSGTGKVLTVGLMGNYAVREAIDHALYPLAKEKEIGLVEPSLRREGGSDHVPFDEAGVPGFWCVQDIADYDKMHHSQADRLEHVRWDDLTEGAQVLAVFAYNVAQLPELLPRKPAKEKKADQ